MAITPSISLTPSSWEYETAFGGGATLAIVAASGGVITLRSPEGATKKLHYGGAGVGAGIGARLPRFGKIDIKVRGKSVGGAGAAEAFPSDGKIFFNNSGGKPELQNDDFRGPCIYIEGGAGLIAGISGSMLLFGLNPALLALTLASLTNPAVSAFAGQVALGQLVNSANGALVMAGANAGLQAGAGIAAYLGAIY